MENSIYIYIIYNIKNISICEDLLLINMTNLNENILILAKHNYFNNE